MISSHRRRLRRSCPWRGTFYWHSSCGPCRRRRPASDPTCRARTTPTWTRHRCRSLSAAWAPCSELSPAGPAAHPRVARRMPRLRPSTWQPGSPRCRRQPARPPGGS
uniref:Uncharacterized protein n=1 Tax=Arundo donax TaxID=35708 RepID=A0A0A9GBR7_ARUDO